MKDEAVQEVVERLVRIETKLDNYEALREKSDKAYSIAMNNTKDIEEMKANARWSWGYMIGLGITIIGYFLTKL